MSTENREKKRLVTRADFDGLVCAALFKELGLIEEIVFVHPKDVADGKIELSEHDITTNLPYDPRCYLAFDHHHSEALKHGNKIPENLVLDPAADSASCVVYRYYGGVKRFANISRHMMAAVDKADAARFTREEILDPSGWVLLSFIMDPRTGFGRFRDFRIGNFDLMMALIDYCREHDIDEILALPDVRERIDLYRQHSALATDQIRRCSTVHDNVVVLDLRDENTIYVCNRFMVYALHPECNCSIHAIWGRGAQNTVYAIGRSIFNDSLEVNIGELCMEYGGGGHAGAGTVQVAHADADQTLNELIDRLTPADDLLDGMPDEEDDEALALDDELASARATLEGVMADNGMALLPSKDDIRDIQARLDRIERMIADMASLQATH